jgi:4-hydroxy-tetrahydrodipicolinate synthase
MIRGIFSALVTPFHYKNIDFDKLDKLIEWQLHRGIHGFVLGGTTGEGFLLTPDEHLSLINHVAQAINNRAPLIANIPAIDMTNALKMVRGSAIPGMTGLMLPTPPYLKLDSRALFEYFKILHDQTHLPLVLYDNPSRCGISLSEDLIVQLAQLPRFQGLKDSSANLGRAASLMTRLPSDFTLICGDDILAPAFYAYGAKGMISVSSNLAPHLVVDQWIAWKDKDYDRFQKLTQQLTPLQQALYCEPLPTALKYALSVLDLCTPEVRSPLQMLSIAGQECIISAMKNAGLIENNVAPLHGKA